MATLTSRESTQALTLPEDNTPSWHIGELTQPMFNLKNTTRLLAFLALGGSAWATVIVDNFNQGITQAPNTYLDPSLLGIGWYYTPSTSYSLVGVQTTYTQTTSPLDINRIVTVSIYSDRPANGGTLLGSGSFDTATARSGAYGGATFAGIALTGGATYFVAFSNVGGLGENQVTFSPDPAGPPGSVAVGPTWINVANNNFNTLASNGTTAFDKPVLRFLGPSPVNAAPEPGSWPMALAGATLLAATRLRKR
jgi:hypothetical protein